MWKDQQLQCLCKCVHMQILTVDTRVYLRLPPKSARSVMSVTTAVHDFIYYIEV